MVLYKNAISVCHYLLPQYGVVLIHTCMLSLPLLHIFPTLLIHTSTIIIQMPSLRTIPARFSTPPCSGSRCGSMCRRWLRSPSGRCLVLLPSNPSPLLSAPPRLGSLSPHSSPPMVNYPACTSCPPPPMLSYRNGDRSCTVRLFHTVDVQPQ